MLQTLLLLAASSVGLPDDDLPQPLADLVRARNDFALELHRALHAGEAPGNAFHSPYSVWTAFALLAEGARGETADALLATLVPGREAASVDDLHAVAEDLERRLAAAAEHVTLTSANALWGQRDHPFAGEVLQALSEHYGAALEGLDFVGNAEAARERINTWVAERTAGHIEDLLPAGSLNELTRLVLTNAVYFLGDWNEPFEPGQSADRAFRRGDGTEVRATFVQATTPRTLALAAFGPDGKPREFEEDATDGFVAVELPYRGERVSFLALRPNAPSGRASLEAALDAARLEEVVLALEPTRVRFAVPKLELRPTYDLADAAKRLGLGALFSPDTADLSGFSAEAEPELFVTDAFHQAFLRLDEKGTEAAAATGIVGAIRSMPLPAPEVALDRPFLFVVRERTCGAILFLGRVEDPR